MKELWNTAQVIFAAIGGWLGYFLGGCDGLLIALVVIFFYLSNEGVSLLENAAHLGLPVPEKMKDILAQLHDRAEKEEN